MTLLSGEKSAAPNESRVRAVILGVPADIRAMARRGCHTPVTFVGALPAGDGQTKRVGGVVVLARAEDFLRCAKLAVPADLLILAAPPASRDEARRILDAAVRAGLKVVIAEQEEGLVFRPLALGDLIGAPINEVDWGRVRAMIAGKRVLVTGGAGSIGGELSRRLAGLSPARLSIFDNSEFNLSTIEQDIAACPGAPPIAIRFGDIRDAEAVKRFFEREKPDLVFHAAAMKHVPIVEANPSEGALTNVLGARNVAEAAAKIGAHLIFVSTDKAANPASVMGATKRIIELYCQALDREAAKDGGPRRIVARLGNVLGSAGSVAPLFERQLAAGGPLTVTDPDVVRFFITIGQAADFLLQAAAVGLDAERSRGVAHILDMGEPLSVREIARDMIRLKGLAPDRDVAISFVGLRPGEKLCEEMTGIDEIEEATISSGVTAARSPPVSLRELQGRIDRIIAAARMGADDAVRRLTLDAAAPARPARAIG